MQEIKQIKYNSSEYFSAVVLRDEILRKPLGIVFTKQFLQQDENDLMFVLIEDDKICATLNYSILSKSSLKMRQVAVCNSMQAKGFGKKLVGFSEKKIKDLAYSRIELHARETAVRFYEKLNYKIIGEGFYEVGILHYKMFKDL